MLTAVGAHTHSHTHTISHTRAHKLAAAAEDWALPDEAFSQKNMGLEKPGQGQSIRLSRTGPTGHHSEHSSH